MQFIQLYNSSMIKIFLSRKEALMSFFIYP